MLVLFLSNLIFKPFLQNGDPYSESFAAIKKYIALILI